MKPAHISRGVDGQPLKPTASPCAVCARPTERECSHIDCPNRRRVTAQPCDDSYHFPACGRKTVPGFERGDME